MKVRGEKSKQYYVDSKQITAKKGKKNHDSYTPNSLSTSHNYHKYQRYDVSLQQNNKKNISLKQFQSVLRSLQSYCMQPNELIVRSKQKQLTAKLYYHLCDKYRVFGDHQQIKKVKLQIDQLLPHRSTICERCHGNGYKCNQAHINYLNEVITEDIEILQLKLEQLQEENEFFCNIIKSKNSNNKEGTVQELKSIISHQQKIIRELEVKEYLPLPKRKKSKLQIFIDEDEA